MTKLQRFAGILSLLLGMSLTHGQNILQPGDPISASSANSPGSEGVANAIDGKPTKYLNFDTRTGGKPSGFVVSPSLGATRVTGISLQSANDAPERDPKVVTVEGSNDATTPTWTTGNWETIARVENIPAYTARFQTQEFSFPNTRPYKHYRVTVLETQTANGCCFQIAEVGLLGSTLPQDVTLPGDPILASSANSPGSEGVANAIDGKPTKYLNFDTRTGGKPSGFVVSPSLGKTLVTGVTLQSANDAPERDPKLVTIEGSNDASPTWAAGNWEVVARVENIPAYTARFQTQTFLFDNYVPYRHYRVTVVETQTSNGCCFQIAEVELLGTSAPKDITQPGDAIYASSANSPGSEGVANAIDGKPTKYLNFDTRTNGKPSGFAVTPALGATQVVGIGMQSANDAPERDPKIITLEGSNDDAITGYGTGNWETIVKLDNIPAYTARFQNQEFYFPNAKKFKHYRFTVLETQTVNGCCFQIAEVELLGVTQSVPDDAGFLVQPSDTPVLDGSTATFFVTVNGPWPLQWYADGNPIAGANTASYTTPAVTAANVGVVYTVKIVGGETSSPAKAVLFTPSATKSIGITFRGGGANGTPTLMNDSDIAGLHPQAHWVNAANAGSGLLPNFDVDPPIDLVDSDGKPSTITFEFQSSGAWGAGTGDASATQRMLNGLNHAQPGSPATLTFSGVPAGNHAVIAYTVGIPLQFQEANYTVKGASEETYFVRVVNADEYNAAPGFYRGSSKDPSKRDLATYVRFDNVRAAADGTVVLTWDTLTRGFDRGAPVNAIQLILNTTPPPAAPVITGQPQPAVTGEGRAVKVGVTATGDGLTYQWRKNGRNLPNGGNVSGATTSELTIGNFSIGDEAVYSVAVFNAGGSVISKNAAIRLSAYNIKDDLVALWKFDETSGTTAANAVAAGKAGTVKGNAAWAAGQVANAFTFDGSSYLEVPSFTAGKRELSLAGWVFVSSDPAADVAFARNALGAIGVGVNVGAGTPAGQFEIGLVVDGETGVARLSAAIGAGPNIVRATSPNKFTAGSWQHIAFSADGAQLRLYLNGSEVASTDYITAINIPEIPYISIGARLNVASDGSGTVGVDENTPNYLTGRLDDLGLWTRGLNAEEVSLAYDAGKAAKSVDTVSVPKPAVTGGTLGVAVKGNSVTINWTSGKLQSAAAVNGPWSDVAGASSPLTESASGAAKFYRTVQ